MINQQMFEDFKKYNLTHPTNKKFIYQYTEEELDAKVKKIPLITEYFKKTFDIDLYISFGTLLGAVRDGNLIPWDDDIDTAYLSKYSEIPQIANEFNDICAQLKKDGMLVKTLRGQIHFGFPGESDCYDVFISFIKDGIYYIQSTTNIAPAESIVPFRTTILRGTEILIPNSPKVWLNKHYNRWEEPMAPVAGVKSICFKSKYFDYFRTEKK